MITPEKGVMIDFLFYLMGLMGLYNEFSSKQKHIVQTMHTNSLFLEA